MGSGDYSVQQYQAAIREYNEARRKVDDLVETTSRRIRERWEAIPESHRIGVLSPDKILPT